MGVGTPPLENGTNEHSLHLRANWSIFTSILPATPPGITWGVKGHPCHAVCMPALSLCGSGHSQIWLEVAYLLGSSSPSLCFPNSHTGFSWKHTLYKSMCTQVPLEWWFLMCFWTKSITITRKLVRNAAVFQNPWIGSSGFPQALQVILMLTKMTTTAIENSWHSQWLCLGNSSLQMHK